MPFIQVNDINMYYQLYNEETSAETAVLLHGLGLNLELWKDITPFSNGTTGCCFWICGDMAEPKEGPRPLAGISLLRISMIYCSC